MKTNILLPTDFSDNAWSAIVYALKLYANEKCTFYLLNSTLLKVAPMSNFSNRLLDTMQKKAKEELLELKEQAEVSNANTNHNFEIILSTENLVDAVKRAIKTHDIDCVVMGTKGASKVKEIFFGSNTVKILKKLKSCPVLVIPEEFDFVEPKQIAFPTDYNRFYGDKELQPLKKLANLFNTKIRVMHIEDEKKLSDIQEYNMGKLEEYLSRFEHSFHWMPNYAKKTIEIKDFIEELNIDILALINYKHSFIESIINEPVVKKIGFHPIVPFFVIPE